MSEDREKAEILKKSLTIVDKLADFDSFEINLLKFTREEEEKLMDLIEQAKKLKKHRLFKLK